MSGLNVRGGVFSNESCVKGAAVNNILQASLHREVRNLARSHTPRSLCGRNMKQSFPSKQAAVMRA